MIIGALIGFLVIAGLVIGCPGSAEDICWPAAFFSAIGASVLGALIGAGVQAIL